MKISSWSPFDTVFLAVTTISFKSTFEAIESVFCAIKFTDNDKSNIKIALLFISLINVVYNCRFKVEFLGFIFSNSDSSESENKKIPISCMFDIYIIKKCKCNKKKGNGERKRVKIPKK